MSETESVVRAAWLSVALLFFLVGSPQPIRGCTSPLILDLDGGGIQTSDFSWPVHFDIDSDGRKELTGWTLPQSGDAFLCLDLDGSGAISSGLELFGNRTLLPDGAFARHGFEALAVHDRVEEGGNQDGMITMEDAIWSRLLLWTDSNHDGISQAAELEGLVAAGVVGLDLDYEVAREYDDAINFHGLAGTFVRSLWPELDIRPPLERGAPVLRLLEMHDVFFQVRESSVEDDGAP